jgi:hypothetical protein
LDRGRRTRCIAEIEREERSSMHRKIKGREGKRRPVSTSASQKRATSPNPHFDHLATTPQVQKEVVDQTKD